MEKDTIFLTFIILGFSFWMRPLLVDDPAPKLRKLQTRLQNNLNKLGEEMTSLQTELAAVKQTLPHEETPTEEEEEADEDELGPVGFSAFHRRREQILKPNENVVFGGVYENEGDHYDNNTGVYTCPVDGLYFFTINIQTLLEPGKQAFVYMLKDETEFLGTVRVKTAGQEGDIEKAAKKGQQYEYSQITFGSGTNSAVTWCKKGSTVLVRSLNDGVIAGGLERFSYSSFTGFLIGTKD